MASLSDELAIAILVFSTFAFVIVTVQLFQSIIANAKGLPNCDERVMGKWATKSGLSRLRGLRAEVDYESPVIFLARRSNQRGPLKDKDIYYADGENYQDYRLDPPSGASEETDATPVANAKPPSPEQKGFMSMIHRRPTSQTRRLDAEQAIPEPKPPNSDTSEDTDPTITRERVSTVAHERVTWVALLNAIQRMERDSENWERSVWDRDKDDNPNRTLRPKIKDADRLAVGIQITKRSFDANPSVKKPYATSTICHIVELAAVLGLYWKEFNRENDRYWAEGNGFCLIGRRVHDFGITFTFEQAGWPSFKKSRLIHTEDIKELCFGSVPTVYRDKTSDTAWRMQRGDRSNQPVLQTLKLGSLNDIAKTLKLIRCNVNTIRYYEEEGYKTSHLFPVAFEILGMLGRTMHQQNRCFTYLPNPTIFQWDKASFSLRRLLKSFTKEIKDLRRQGDGRWSTPDFNTIHNMAVDLHSGQNKLPNDRDDNYAPEHFVELHRAIAVADDILTRKDTTKSVVFDVLRRHLQEVLLAINTSKEKAAGRPLTVAEFAQQTDIEENSFINTISHHLSAMSQHLDALRAEIQTGSRAKLMSQTGGAHSRDDAIVGEISFDDFFGIPPETLEAGLMQKYFDLIRPRVVSTNTTRHHDPPATKASLNIHREESILEQTSPPQNRKDEAQEEGKGKERESPVAKGGETEAAEAQISTTDPPDSPIGPRHASTMPPAKIPAPTPVRDVKRSQTMEPLSQPETVTTKPTKDELERNYIWCTLVFRMICWLLLHDFDKEDVQKPKGELMGNRLPVYIM